MTVDDLPHLPEYANEFRPRWPGDDGGFTGEQMRMYARAAIAQAVEKETAELRAQVARLTADAERYRLLRDDFSPMTLNIDGNHAWVYRRNFSLRGPTLDAAIDTAILSTNGQP